MPSWGDSSNCTTFRLKWFSLGLQVELLFLFFSNHAQCQLDQIFFQLHSPGAVFIAVGPWLFGTVCQVEIMILSSGKNDVAKVQVQNCSPGKFQTAVSFRIKKQVCLQEVNQT